MRYSRVNFEKESRSTILAMAEVNILDLERRSGPDYRFLARQDRESLTVHQGEVGQPCTSCGQPWPCGFIQAIFADL